MIHLQKLLEIKVLVHYYNMKQVVKVKKVNYQLEKIKKVNLHHKILWM